VPNAFTLGHPRFCHRLFAKDTTERYELMMTRSEYEKSVCDRLSHATHVRFRLVSFADGTAPEVGDCHRNADRWVQENPGATVVRGWVTYANFGLSIGLAAHSVVRTRDGQFLDITPLAK